MMNEKTIEILNQQNCINGKTFVITGRLSKTRSFFAAEIRKKGGIMAGAVNAKTDYLIIGEKFGNTKVNAAFKYGTYTVTEEEFLKMLEE